MALRVGTENKTKVRLAIGLVTVAVAFAIYTIAGFFTGSPTPAPPPPTPAPVAAPAARSNASLSSNGREGANGKEAAPFAHEAIKLPSSSALDPTLHPEVMAQAESTAYTGNGRNIFSLNSVAAAPVKIEKAQAFRPSGPVVPAGPPPPPAIDLKFYGYSSRHGGARQIFLLHGDDIFLAHEGDVVDRRYRVVAIGPFSVEIEDIPYHNTQSLPMTQN